jgi:uncharacterized protein YbaP (TraB family)
MFSIVLSSGYAQSPNGKLANTLLWEITGNGLSKPSYLYGTMHVSNKIAFHLKDSFFTAISKVDYVATELNPDTWLYDMMNSDFYKVANNYAQQNGGFQKGFYEQMVAFYATNTLVLKSALVDNSQLVNSLMYRMTESGMNHNYEEGTYVDMYIYQTGKKLNKSILGLEKFDQAMEMMAKSMMPDENPDKSEMSKNKWSRTGNISEKLEKAYRKGDLNEIDSLERMTYMSKNFEKYLIVERNKIMAFRMDSIMKRYGALFTAVGVAHLPGKEGILKLLEAKGYKVRPVVSAETPEGKKMRDKIEKKSFSHATATYYLPDSTLQYTLPGKLINANWNDNIEFLLYPDIVNGAYYSIYRLKHYARIFGRNESFVSQQVDSVIYESVPGKILNKKAITSNSGYRGVTVASKLPNGKIMQFAIYYTPIEIIICKAGGTEQASKSQIWTNFFSSLKFNEKLNLTSWKPISLPKMGFSINMPEDKAIFYGSDQTQEIRIHAFDRKDSAYYFLISNNLNDYKYLEDDTFELSYLAEQLSESINAKIISRKLTSNNNALEALYETNINHKTVKARVQIKSSRYYILGSVGKDSAIGKVFFQSFKPLKLADDAKSYSLTDSSMFFTTSCDHSSYDKKDELLELMRKMNLPAYMFRSEEFSGLFQDRSKQYISDTQPLAVEVNRKKLPGYYSVQNADSLWTDQIKNQFSKSGNYISPQVFKTEFKDSLSSTSFLVKDSLSRRAIWVKMVLKNDHLFTLSTIIDTIDGATTWQEKFYSDFKPWDTCKVYNVFEPKGKLFLSDLTTKDSVCLAKASETYFNLDFIGKDTATDNGILRFIEAPKFSSLNTASKIVIIRFLSYFNDDKAKTYPILERLYKEAADTSAIQFAVLNALAGQKNSKSTQLLIRLMEQNLPLSGDEGAINGLFTRYSDSLELAGQFMPLALNYLKYPEYKPAVLRLFANLVLHKKLAPPQWAAYKNTLLNEAQIELKRYHSEVSAHPSKNAKIKDIPEFPNSYQSDETKSDAPDITSEAPWLDNTGPSILACYAIGFAQIYSSDKQARQFVDKVIATGHKGLVYSCSLALKKSNQPVNDTIWTWLASDNYTRMYFCDWLEITKDTALYPKKYYNQLCMSNSWLLAVSKEEKKDSVQFMKRVLVSNVNGSGYLYFFKYKVGKDWMLNYVGFQPSDTSKMLSDFGYCDYNVSPLPNQTQKTIDEEINKICKRIKLVGRQRIKAQARNYNSNYYTPDEENY